MSRRARILTDAVPLVGVLGLGWSLVDLVLVYWIETGLVGALLTTQALSARARVRQPRRHPVVLGLTALGFAIAPLLWLLVGGLLAATFSAPGDAAQAAAGAGRVGSTPGWAPLLVVLADGWWWVTVAAVSTPHLTDFAAWWRGGRRLTSGREAWVEPAGRGIVALFLTVLVGAVVIDAIGAPVLGLVALIAARTLFDVVPGGAPGVVAARRPRE